MDHPPFTTPEAFTKAFLEVATQWHDKLAELWLQKKPYTKFIIGDCFPAIGERLGLEVWPKNYYYLDSVFFREKDNDHFPEGVMNAKCFEVALEHEHNIDKTAQEMNKLQLFNAPLKVLITYDDNDADRDVDLERYRRIIGFADIFGDIASTRRQLVIFGRKGKSNVKINWSAFVYRTTGFVPLARRASAGGSRRST